MVRGIRWNRKIEERKRGEAIAGMCKKCEAHNEWICWRERGRREEVR